MKMSKASKVTVKGRMAPNRRLIELKYKIAWYIGALLSFLLYFSGFVILYDYLRRRYVKNSRVIVLMYHRIGNNNNTPDISVTTKNFDYQMAYLKRNFNIVSLDELVEKFKYNSCVEKDTIAITFDDGFRDNYINAYPILRKYNIPATIFVVTGSVGKQFEMLSKDEINIMQKGNIIFGAHTVTHKILSEVDRQTALSEINDSKFMLEEILQERVKYFAYPKGKKRDFTDETVQMVKEAGYVAAFSTENGNVIYSNSNIFALNRIGIRNYPLFVFKVRVSGIFESKWFYLLRRYANLT